MSTAPKIVPKLAGLNCPNCGASVELRTFGQAINVVCPNCHSVLDAQDPNVAVLQKAQSAEKVEPLIPLGTRGTFEGVKFEAIGFQVRTENDPDDGPDSWQEYLLYNPYRGYRYLAEYNGHWNYITVLHAIPEPHSDTRVSLKTVNFQLFSRGAAQTTYIIGEFPWTVRVGDSAAFADYVAPPEMLSSETTPEETTWSQGHYTPGLEIWQAFGLPGTAPAAQGTFANQPSSFSGGIGLWGTALKLMLGAFLLAIFFQGAGAHNVFHQDVTLAGGATVTPEFNVDGHESALQIEAQNRGTQSFYLHYALVDQATGQARSFARSIGTDDKAVVPSVKPGRYALRMEAEPAGAQFNLIVSRKAGSFSLFWIVAALLAIPPLLHSLRGSNAERVRWQGSSR
jgi:hypothetical protein